MEVITHLYPLNLEKACFDGSALPVPQSSGLQTLTTELSRGSEQAFERFYSEYSPRLYRFALVLTRGQEDSARELHQQVMIKTCRKMKIFSDDTLLWKWLAQVTRNCWKDILRRSGRDERHATEFPPQSAIAEADDALLQTLEQALLALPDEERILLEKFYFDGLPQKSISGETGRTVKALQSELARIRKKLKEFIVKAL
jgi:RNA polymerase sigma-70 factor (ECF subfamily)